MTDDPRNPKIPDFSDLADAYMKADDFAHKIKFESSLSTAFQKLRDKYGDVGDKASLDLCQLELEVQEFVFVDGKAMPKWIGVDAQGKETKFPDLSGYTPGDLDYFKTRLSKSSDGTLKARYAHLLWESKEKHIQFAKAAIDEYLISIDQIRKFELTKPMKSRGHRIEKSLESLWFLSRKVNFKINEVVALMRDLFLNYDYNNPSSVMVRLSILNVGLLEWKQLGISLFPDVENVFDLQCQKTDIFGKIEWLLVLGRIDNKSRLTRIKWRDELSQTYENLGDDFRKSQNNGAAAEYFQRAIELEKVLKNQTRVVALEKKFDEARKNIKLAAYGQTLDLTEQAKRAETLAKNELDQHKDSILSFLNNSIESFLPKVANIRQESQAMLQELTLQRNLPQAVLDHRGNTVEHFATPDEIAKYWELSTYKLHLECGTTLLLRAFFLFGIESGVINSITFSRYLKEETWLSSKRSVWSPAVQTDETFADLVLPSLDYFIEQTKKALKNKGIKPDFTLCTDSLSVKIEGLLRDLCEQNGETTFFMRDDKLGRKVVNEQDITALLFSKTVKEIFSEEEMSFMRFILIEKLGANLRHKVAHTLIYQKEYSFELMVLLVAVLIVVARKAISKP